MITFISYILAKIFYFPIILLNIIRYKIALLLLKSAKRKVGHYYYGYRSKIAFKLIKQSVCGVEEIIVEVTAWTVQKEKEEIMKAIRADKAYPYVVKDERNLTEDNQTRFMCKYLDPSTAASLQDQLYNVSGVGGSRRERLLSGTQQLKILQTCLVGWENFLDDDGSAVNFDSSRPNEMIAMILPKYRREIVEHIQGESESTEGEE